MSIPGTNGYSRDWRVLAEIILPHDTVTMLLDSPDPVRETLKLWPTEATVGEWIMQYVIVKRVVFTLYFLSFLNFFGVFVRFSQIVDPRSPSSQTADSRSVSGQLISVMEGIERFDVLEDCMESILDDCRDFLRRRDQWRSEPSIVHLTMFRAFVIHAVSDIGTSRLPIRSSLLED